MCTKGIKTITQSAHKGYCIVGDLYNPMDCIGLYNPMETVCNAMQEQTPLDIIIPDGKPHLINAI